MSDPRPVPRQQLRLSLTFGALAEPLHKQLGVAKAVMVLYQRLADNVTFLSVHQFLREAETRRMRQKLLDLIAQDEREEVVTAIRRRCIDVE